LQTRSTAKKKKRGRRRLRLVIAACAVVFVLLLGFLIDSALYYGKIHAGVTISGRSVSGLTRDEASATLTRLVDFAANNPITLTSDDDTWTVKPSDVGTEIDVAGAVTAAMNVTRGNNFLADGFRRIILYFTDRDVPLTGTVDDVMMEEVLAGIAEDIDVPPVDPGLAIEGTEIRVIEGKKGRVVDQETLRAELESLVLTLHSTELVIPMIVKEPSMTVEDTRPAVAQAETMVSGPVQVTHGDKSWTLTAEQIAASMGFTSEDRNGVATLTPVLSAEKLAGFLDKVAEGVAQKPQNATFKGDGTKAWVVPGVNGQALDREKTAEALMEAALKATGRTATAVVKVTEPDRTTEEAKAMGITDVLGEFTTTHGGSAGRQTNVRITTQYASNVLLAPGEIYDFDKVIGPRTADRGYEMAPGITAGELEDQLGGGICQVSTTLFNAAFFAGLEIVERKNHSIYIDHYPKGRDATVSAGGPNMRFRNDTGKYILVRGVSDGVTTKFVIYGTDDGREVTYSTSDFYDQVARTDVTIPNKALGTGTTVIKSQGQAGKSIKVVRTVKSASGNVIHKDTFVSIWNMKPRQIEVGTGSTTTTTSPTTTVTTTAPTTGTTTATTAPPDGGTPSTEF
jgi:vancomycin resistance protein YoaR